MYTSVAWLGFYRSIGSQVGLNDTQFYTSSKNTIISSFFFLDHFKRRLFYNFKTFQNTISKQDYFTFFLHHFKRKKNCSPLDAYLYWSFYRVFLGIQKLDHSVFILQVRSADELNTAVVRPSNHVKIWVV